MATMVLVGITVWVLLALVIGGLAGKAIDRASAEQHALYAHRRTAN